MGRSNHAALRHYYAQLVAGRGGVRDPRIIAAFEAVARERFVGPGPWKVYTLGGSYIDTPSDDLAFLYQDVLVALASERGLNNGEPSLHARCLQALAPARGKSVLHVGAGTGYYTALLAQLVAPSGSVVAFEIADDLAERAAANLAGLPEVRLRHASGNTAKADAYDAIYVNAGATHPLDAWLDALRVGGRLLFPLTPDRGLGGMLLVTRRDGEHFAARFVCPAAFVPCEGARDAATAAALATAFTRGDMWQVRTLHRRSAPAASCWVAGNGWWLAKG